MSVGAWRATRAKVRVDLVWIDHSDPSCLPTTLRGLIRWPAFVIGFHGSLGQWLYLWTWLVRVTASFRDDVVPLGSTPGSSSFFFGFSCFPFFFGSYRLSDEGGKGGGTVGLAFAIFPIILVVAMGHHQWTSTKSYEKNKTSDARGHITFQKWVW